MKRANRIQNTLLDYEFAMTEGKGYCARRLERKNQKGLATLIRHKDQITVVPDDLID